MLMMKVKDQIYPALQSTGQHLENLALPMYIFTSRYMCSCDPLRTYCNNVNLISKMEMNNMHTILKWFNQRLQGEG